MEIKALTQFELVDENTVRVLAEQDPDLLPSYAINPAKNLNYNRTQVNNAVRTAISNGESINKTANSVSFVTAGNMVSALRVTRTSMTAAQNMGRMSGYQSALALGIGGKIEWIATMDKRVRHSHAMLDGELVEVGKPFSNGCKFPADPEGAPEEIFNCRCTTGFAIDELYNPSDNLSRYAANGMSYTEWKLGHALSAKQYNNSSVQNVVVNSIGATYNEIYAARDIEVKNANLSKLRQSQLTHIEGTPQNRNAARSRGIEPSCFTISIEEIRELIKKYAGHGTPDNLYNYSWNRKENCTADHIVGYVIIKGEKIPTRSFKIHYSDDGVHAVPRFDKGGEPNDIS